MTLTTPLGLLSEDLQFSLRKHYAPLQSVCDVLDAKGWNAISLIATVDGRVNFLPSPLTVLANFLQLSPSISGTSGCKTSRTVDFVVAVNVRARAFLIAALNCSLVTNLFSSSLGVHVKKGDIHSSTYC
jgi:hypothetical protein